MRYWLMVMLMGSLPALAEPTDAADTAQTRKEAAERYAKVADVRKLMTDSVEAMAQRMPEAQRERFRAVMTTHFGRGAGSGDDRGNAEAFHDKELNALADFYGSEKVRSAMAKFGLYMADGDAAGPSRDRARVRGVQREQTPGRQKPHLRRH